MFLSNVSVSRPVTITMVMAALMIGGIIAFINLPVDLLPNISQPALRIYTKYEGGSPKEIEEEITKRLEDEFTSVKQLISLTSVSRPEESEITLIFDWSKKIDIAIMETQEKIDLAVNDLPENADKPLIEKFDPNSRPVLIFNCISGLSQKDFAFLLNYKIKPELERCAGVARVKVIGAMEPEINIQVEPEKIFARKISIEEIKNKLESENLNYQGGKLKLGKYDIMVRTIGEFKNASELRNLIIRNSNGNVVYLRDVAAVNEKFKPVNEFINLNGAPTVTLEIYKESSGNTIKTTQTVLSKINQLSEKFKQDKIEFSAIYNQSYFIDQSIKMVKENAITGALLAIIVIYLFLRSFSSTLIITSCMPISIIAAFILFYFTGLSINLFSLAGLALATGMVVDNAVVILENTYRHISEGRNKNIAAITATTEVGPAVISSTATTLAVFIPIIFIKGQAGIIFRDLSLVITYTMLFSIFVSFTFIPMLSSRFLSLPDKTKKPNFIIKFLDKIEFKLYDFYKVLINFVTGTVIRRILTLTAGIFLFFLTVYLIPEKEFFPKSNQDTLELKLYFDKNISLEYTKSLYSDIEKKIVGINGVKTVNTNINQGFTKVFVILNDNKSSEKIIEKINDILKKSKLNDFVIEMNSPVENSLGLTGNGDIMIKIIGPAENELQNISNSIQSELSKIKGVSKHISSLSTGIKEINVEILPEKISELGVSLKETGEELKNILVGVTTTTIRYDERSIDIRIIEKSGNINSINDIYKKYITTKSGNKVKLSDIARIKVLQTNDVIYHDNKVKSADIKLWVKGVPLGEIINKLSNNLKNGVIDRLTIPDGYEIKISGLSQTLLESFNELWYSLAFAIVFVYMIMAAQFESFIHPVTLLISVPLALLGAFAGLRYLNLSLSITALIGVIILVGVVVNNAIILVDYTNILRKRGMDRIEAIKLAGVTRVRPILITASSTVIGMFPLSLGLGLGAELYQGLAVVNVWGLVLSTILTLLYVPTIYCLFEDIGDLITLLVFKIKMKFEKFE
ncbi:efflux RND transporter permease subunit [Candidatus Dependentiae bacterium]|nr:efflux RND transporter permease subunit [Candidatus Dependentiae bacterium]